MNWVLRHHFGVPFAITMALIVIVEVMSKFAGWSRGTLGVTVVAIALVGLIFRLSLKARYEDRQRGASHA